MNGLDFKNWCKERGLTVKEAANKFYVGEATIFRYFKTTDEIPKTISSLIEAERRLSQKEVELQELMRKKEDEIKVLKQAIVALATTAYDYKAAS